MIMTILELIKKLISIDRLLYLGDKDGAHFSIQALIKEINDTGRIEK